MDCPSYRQQSHRRSEQRIPSRRTDRDPRSGMTEANPTADKIAPDVSCDNPGQRARPKAGNQSYPKGREIELMQR